MSFEILAKNDVNWYNNSTYWCHDLATFSDVERMFTVIHNALTYDLSNSLQTKTKRADYEMLIGPCYFVIFLLLLLFLC